MYQIMTKYCSMQNNLLVASTPVFEVFSWFSLDFLVICCSVNICSLDSADSTWTGQLPSNKVQWGDSDQRWTTQGYSYFCLQRNLSADACNARFSIKVREFLKCNIQINSCSRLSVFLGLILEQPSLTSAWMKFREDSTSRCTRRIFTSSTPWPWWGELRAPAAREDTL